MINDDYIIQLENLYQNIYLSLDAFVFLDKIKNEINFTINLPNVLVDLILNSIYVQGID